MQTLIDHSTAASRVFSRLGYSETGEYRRKVRGCWQGKAMGGGIGAPYEGVPYPLQLTAADLYIDPGPNDDLELQLLWLCLAERYGLELRARHFAPVWLEQMGRGFGCDEYGMAVFNLRRGLTPPATGYADNWFTDGMGAAIRAEIWGCLFPGNPAAAAFYAEQDAILDHHGEGVWAEIFLAATVSEAFFCASPAEALERGLSHIPAETRVAQAVRFVRELTEKTSDPILVRQEIMSRFGSHNFTDCVMNLAFITAALLLGGGDFRRTVLTAVNFGMDTDCTGATSAALFGLVYGPEAFGITLPDERIAVSPFLDRKALPDDIAGLADRTVRLAQRLARESTENPVPSYPVYVPYVPYVPDAATAALSHSSWRIETGEAAPESGRVVELPGFHADLSAYCHEFAPLYLSTTLSVPADVDDAQLMFCAGTGITVWINGRMALNYHGRQKPLPAFHRTEGGGTVFFKLEKDRRYSIRVRLLFCRSPLTFSFAAGNSNYHLIPGAVWECSPQ